MLVYNHNQKINKNKKGKKMCYGYDVNTLNKKTTLVEKAIFASFENAQNYAKKEFGNDFFNGKKYNRENDIFQDITKVVLYWGYRSAVINEEFLEYKKTYTIFNGDFEKYVRRFVQDFDNWEVCACYAKNCRDIKIKLAKKGKKIVFEIIENEAKIVAKVDFAKLLKDSILEKDRVLTDFEKSIEVDFCLYDAKMYI